MGGAVTADALVQLKRDAETWAHADQAHQDAIQARQRNIIRAVREDRLPLKTVGDAYGVTRQYISRIVLSAESG
jgi:DNA-directed RNA polymerase specialized sigma subunit